MRNVDAKTVAGFSFEWTKFDQSNVSDVELRTIFDLYFAIFPWSALPENAIGFDLGCGSGRWARFVAPRVGKLHCIDASKDAIVVASRNLHELNNCEFHVASVDEIPLQDGTMDFGYSLGVLHHVPNTLDGIRSCVAKLKPGAPLLLYLYYAFDNRPSWFYLLWRLSDVARRVISQLPHTVRHFISFGIAILVYLPLARVAYLLEKLGSRVEWIPLAAYRHYSFYTIRTDALDRFGTNLEKRFTAQEIREMMEKAGLERIEFSESVPYWCVLGYKKS